MAPRCGVCVSIAALALSPACIFAGDGESRETAFTNAEVTAQTLNQAVTGPDYVYNTVDAYTVFDSSDFVYVGESYGSIDLLVRNTGRVNSFFGYVGYGVDSDGNVVTIEGTGATDTLTRWTSTGMLTIGVSGSANSFTVQDGADVVCGYVIVGDEDGSNKNKVTIDGTGSTWTISSAEGLTVGKSGRGARFFVVNGATLGTTSLTLGKNASSGANSLTITGYGSTATLSGAATIGDKGESNALYIEARGSLTTNSDIVIGAGDEADALLGCDNLVQVTGTGDTDTDTALNCEYGSVYVGRNGSDNTLSILGGALLNAYSLIVGEGASSDVDLGCNNAVTISGVGTRAPGPVSVSLGVYGSGNSLTVSDHAVFNANDTYVGMNASSGGNTVTLVNATWNASGSRLFVGYYGGSNSFIVQNGGTLSAGTTYVGTESGSNKNLISFDGASTWSGTSSSNLLTIGYTGRGNRMIVSGGSSVSRHNLVIGRNADSASNSVTIDGVGTTFTTSTTYDFHTADSSMIIVGKNGSNNSMYVSGGAAVTTWSLYVGEGDGTAGHGADNALSISGAGSSLTATSRIDVGWLGSGNSMSVGNEAAVQSDIGGVGTNVGSDNNSVTLSGASTWTITQQLHVGNSGNFNSMSVSGGSSVAANVIYSGNSGSDNAISVSGTGSTLTSSGSIYLGFSGGYRNKVKSSPGAARAVTSFLSVSRGTTVAATTTRCSLAVRIRASLSADASTSENTPRATGSWSRTVHSCS
jgi:T5SS/PEP-CTERM-associated repeat protein